MATIIDNYLRSRCSICAALIAPPTSFAIAELRESFEKGCVTCTLIWSALSEKIDLDDPTLERVNSIGGYGFFNLAVGSAQRRFRTNSLWDHVSVTLAVDGEGYCPPSLEWLPILPKSPLTRTKDGDIKLIKNRIEDCRQNHPGCPNFDDEGRYLALSHRWGDPKSSHKKLLTLKAIEVSRGLGIQFLWIDSLCIVQNDKVDWEFEAGRMASVYSNAFATVFADRAIHSDDGLFQTKKEKEALQSIRFMEYEDKESGVATRVLVQTQIDSNTANFATEVHELFCRAGQSISQLKGRGWILQEECLSRRRIHFTETELKWKCPTVANCECGIPTAPDMADPSTNFSILANPETGQNQPWKTPTWLWQQLVEHYTSRNLTYETDRLIALAGMATKISRSSKNYLGGLWHDQLNSNILWKAAGSPARCYRTAEYVAPSWSWASVSGNIRFIPLSKETRFVWQILDAKCVPKASTGDFGQVESGYLQVRSKVVHVKVEEKPQNMRKEIAQERWDSGDTTWRPRGDEVRYLTVVPKQVVPDAPLPLSTVLELDVQSDWDDLISEGQSDFRLLCVALTDTFWEGYAAERALCLLLSRSPEVKDCWERVCYVFLKGTWMSWEPYVLDEDITIL
ncbi:HET-domain-containing protein [Hypoxylon crocopeplum]|nr:HET-domain-containing protein [Hypoxylon crocopeplum]